MLDLELNEGQQLLRESVGRFIEREYDFERHRRSAADEGGFSHATWKQFADLGWLGVGLDENFGSARDVAILMEGFGRGLVVEPFLASIVMAAKAVDIAGDEAQKEEIVGQAIAGDLLLSFAYAEPRSRYDIAHVETRATQSGGRWILNGRKGLVLNGDTARRFIVTARTAGDERDCNGLSLFIVDSRSEGIEIRGYPTNDSRRAAEVEFADVPGSLLGNAGEAWPVVCEVVDRAAAAICAESLGLMSVLNELTISYSKTREQFGQPIGRFQALQHRMVDMFVALEESRSMTTVYMADVDSADSAVRQKAVSAMKVQCDRAGRTVGQEAIQLHGGIAMTDDYAAGHYFKRLSVIHRMFGDIDWHLDRFAGLTQDS